MDFMKNKLKEKIARGSSPSAPPSIVSALLLLNWRDFMALTLFESTMSMPGDRMKVWKRSFARRWSLISWPCFVSTGTILSCPKGTRGRSGRRDRSPCSLPQRCRGHREGSQIFSLGQAWLRRTLPFRAVGRPQKRRAEPKS